MSMLQQMLQFIEDPQNTFWQHTTDTIKLSVVSIALALAIGLPLGVLVAQRPVLAFLATNLTGLVRAIPTLAVLFVMILVLKQIGFVPSVIALTILGIPPILLNTIAGLRGVDPAAVDAARGMGMTRWQVLSRIQLPLILPVVAAGVRNAAVQIVATVPLAGLINGGGYGDYIASGLLILEIPMALVGAVGIALLALIADFGLGALQRAVTPAGIRITDLRGGVGALPARPDNTIGEPAAA